MEWNDAVRQAEALSPAAEKEGLRQLVEAPHFPAVLSFVMRHKEGAESACTNPNYQDGHRATHANGSLFMCRLLLDELRANETATEGKRRGKRG
jgi:hypothetical protein